MNENKDVLRLCDTAANLSTALREKQHGFETDTHKTAFKAPGGTVYKYWPSGASDVAYNNLVIASGATFGSDLVVDNGGVYSDSAIINTDTLVVNASGYENKVGIGVSTPTTNLDLAGTLGLSPGNNQGIIRRTTVNGSNGLRLAANTSDTYPNDTYPGAVIDIHGGSLTDGYEGNIFLTAYGAITDANRNSIIFRNRSGVNTTSIRMKMDYLGRFGIGTETPGTSLCVNGGVSIGDDAATADNNLHVVGTVDAATYQIGPGNTTSSARIRTDTKAIILEIYSGSAWTEAVRFTIP